MKVLLSTILLLATVCGCLADTVAIPKLDAEIQNQLTKAAIQAFVRNNEQELASLIRTHCSVDADYTETRATLFPPLPEDIPLEDFEGVLTDELGDLLVGNYSFTNVTLKGASNLDHWYQLLFPLPSVSVKFNLTTGTITLAGTHDTELSALVGLNNITGQGPFELKVVDGFVDLNLTILPNVITDKLRITKFELDLAGQEIAINFANTEHNGQPIDWVEISESLNELLTTNLEDIKAAVIQLVMVNGNELLEACTITEFVNLDFSCIFGEGDTTGSTTVETTPVAATTPPGDSAASRFAQVSGLMMLLPVMYLFA